MNDNSDDEFARQDERFAYITQLTLRTERGAVVAGTTADVSLGGAFLEITHEQENIFQGDEGVAAVKVQQEERSFEMVFPCVVARVTPRGIGLTFDEVAPDEANEADEDTAADASDAHASDMH